MSGEWSTNPLPAQHIEVYGEQLGGDVPLILDGSSFLASAMWAHLNEESLAAIRQIVAEELAKASQELSMARQEQEALRQLIQAYEHVLQAGVALAGVSEQVGSIEQFAEWRRWVLAWKGKAEGLLNG